MSEGTQPSNGPGHTCKPGVRTSEFWLTLAAMTAASILFGLGKLSEEHWFYLIGGGTGLYNLVRGFLKSGIGLPTPLYKNVRNGAVLPLEPVAQPTHVIPSVFVDPAATILPSGGVFTGTMESTGPAGGPPVAGFVFPPAPTPAPEAPQ